MMKLVILSVFDSAAGIFQRPFTAQSRGEAIRSFSDICCDKEHPLGQHPGDYTLYAIGSYDDQSAEVKDYDNEKVITGVEAAIVGDDKGRIEGEVR